MPYSSPHSAFTLIELSIVLVIISLVTGGVIGGKTLIQSAKQQGLIVDMANLATAVNTFQSQYDALPGDMRDATEYWPSAPICNGNGNGKVHSRNSLWTGYCTGREVFNVWPQLSLSGIINGSYHIDDNIDYEYRVGSWAPQSAIARVTSSLIYECIHNKCLNYLALGSYASNDWGDYNGHIILPKVAKFIDKKIDDGIPLSGKFLASGSLCINAGQYNLATTTFDMHNSVAHGQDMGACGIFQRYQ